MGAVPPSSRPIGDGSVGRKGPSRPLAVHLRLRGWLRDSLPEGQASIDVPAGTTVSGLMDVLRIPVGPCLWILNGESVGYDMLVQDGDELEVALMASGG
jgi:sulfur carrier protein ThiS